jgi:hypothetical protein
LTALPQPIDTRRVARVLCALAGGIHTTTEARADAAAIEAAYPGTGGQVRGLRALHARAVTWAVCEQGVRGVIIVASGFPCAPDPHAEALGVMPGVRVVLADPDDEATLINEAVLGRDPRVRAIRARALDPVAVLCSSQALALPGPLMLLLPVVAALWPPDVAASALAEYRRLLPSGSLLALTLWVPDGGPAWEECLALWRGQVGPIYGHSPADVAGWLKDAGFKGVGHGVKVPRVEDVRVVTEEMRWMERAYRTTHPGRMVKAIARVP